MADHAYTTGFSELLDGTIDFLVDTIRMMLCNTGYTSNKDDLVVDAAGANDPVDHEASGTGYIAGWGNSGRKTLASKSVQADLSNDRVDMDAADITWTALNGDVGAITYAMWIKEGGADDTTSRLLGHHDFSVTPNGGDVTMQIDDLVRNAI